MLGLRVFSPLPVLNVPNLTEMRWNNRIYSLAFNWNTFKTGLRNNLHIDSGKNVGDLHLNGFYD